MENRKDWDASLPQNPNESESRASAAEEARARLNQGFELHRQRKLAEAEVLYEEALRFEPNNFHALGLLGAIALDTGRIGRAAELIARAIAINPNDAAAHNNLGNALNVMKRHGDALACYDRAIELEPDYADAHNNRGVALGDLKRFEEALASYDRAIALKPNYAGAYKNRGVAFQALGRNGEALACYDKAVALNPNDAEAHYNRGNALNGLERREDAYASFAEAVRLDPVRAQFRNNLGSALKALKRQEEALAQYDRAIALKPDYPEAYYNRGLALGDLLRHEEALASFDRAVTVRPDYAEAHNNRAYTLVALERHKEALASAERAIALKPDFAEAHYNRGNALFELQQLTEALASYKIAAALKPDSRFLLGSLLQTKMKLCDWSDLDATIAQFVDKIERAEDGAAPFTVLSASGSPEIQRRAAETYANAKLPPDRALPAIERREDRDKIRIGYFSSDLREHAVAILLAEFFEKHDSSRFHRIGFSFGPATGDVMQRRLTRALDQFVEVRARSDKDIALLARAHEIDIAVDLNGYTGGGRHPIFAYRAAPIQVNYLGYPGTMGADYIDYLIADPTLIPVASQKYYTEKIVYLPDTYQPNDTTRPIPDRTPTRAEARLPEEGFVFCCFNNNHKINASTFDIWMRILKRVDASVLWLLEDNSNVVANLRKEAVARGIAAERVVFAKRVPLPDHLARHRLADLFLDTLPYNAHTTASDALWAGLPVLTQSGEAFASRVGASILNAAGLPELVTETREAYEALAVALTTDRDRLAAIRHKLARNRHAAPIFDTARYARHIEAGFAAMVARYRAGLPPDHIWVEQIAR